MSDHDPSTEPQEPPKPLQEEIDEAEERGDYIGEDGIAVAQAWGEIESGEDDGEDDPADS